MAHILNQIPSNQIPPFILIVFPPHLQIWQLWKFLQLFQTNKATGPDLFSSITLSSLRSLLHISNSLHNMLLQFSDSLTSHSLRSYTLIYGSRLHSIIFQRMVSPPSNLSRYCTIVLISIFNVMETDFNNDILHRHELVSTLLLYVLGVLINFRHSLSDRFGFPVLCRIGSPP